MLKRGELMSLTEWQQCRAEPSYGPIYQHLRDLYYPQELYQRLDNFLLLKKLCEQGIQQVQHNGDYQREPIVRLLQQAQLFIEYILNAKNAEDAERLLQQREYYSPYYPKYITPPPKGSAMARALFKASHNKEGSEPTGQKRNRFNWLNCIAHLHDLQTGKLRQVSEEEQDDDMLKRVGRYSPQDREAYRILPAARHRGYVHLIVDPHTKRFVIQDFHTLNNDGEPSPWLCVVTPEGDQFAISPFRDAHNLHATSSLNFGRAVLFAGQILVQGHVNFLLGDDPHYETEMINTIATCKYFIDIGLCDIAEAKRIRNENILPFAKRLETIELHPLQRELIALYGIESTRRSFFNETPAFKTIWENAQTYYLDENELKNRAVRFTTIQAERFKSILPHEIFRYTRHLKALERIESDPFIANKENAMNAYEQKKAEKLLEWACQKINTELEALKQILLSIMRDVLNQRSQKTVVEYLTRFLQEIAMTSMAINTPDEPADKPLKISRFITEREKLFQNLRHDQHLKAEHQSLIEKSLSEFLIA